MPKANKEQKARARELFEQKGWSLAKISKELDISVNTVKSWKRRDKWGTGATGAKTKKVAKEKTRKVAPASIDNLLKNQAPRFEEGNQAALKHGLYAKHLPPWINEILESIDPDEDELEKLKSVIEVHYALYIGAINKVDLKKGGLKALNEAAAKLGTLITQYKTLKAKVGTTTEDDEFIEALERSIPLIWGEEDE